MSQFIEKKFPVGMFLVWLGGFLSLLTGLMLFSDIFGPDPDPILSPLVQRWPVLSAVACLVTLLLGAACIAYSTPNLMPVPKSLKRNKEKR